jgi:hypothetical protein
LKALVSRFIRFTFVLAACAPPATAADPTGQSLLPNTLNPAIGFGGLFLGSFASDAAKSTGSFEESAEVPGSFIEGPAVPGEPYAFGLQEAELTLNAFVDPYWKFTANIVFAPDEVVPEEVFAVTTGVPYVSFKIGKFKAAFGKHGLLHVHAFPFIEPALAIASAIGGEGYNDGGIEAAWLTPLPWFTEVTLGAYSGAAGDDPGTVNPASARRDDFAFLGRLRNYVDATEADSLEFGLSALGGRGGDDAMKAVLGADFTFRTLSPTDRTRRGLVIQGEYLHKTSHLAGSPEIREQQGWYASARFRFAQGWWIGARTERVIRQPVEGYTPSDLDGDFVQDVEPVAGGALYDPVTLTGDVRRHTVQVVWAKSEFSAIRLNYSYGTTDTGGGAEPDRRVLIQFIQFIGAHPAHSF